MPSISTINRSLQYLRRQGGIAAKVERPWNPYSKVRNDLFGFADILWVCKDGYHHYIQCCPYKEYAPHATKIRSNARARWLNKHPHVVIEIHLWRKRTIRGHPRWELTIRNPL